MAAKGTWESLVADKKRRQQAAVPSDWLLKSAPADTVLDVRAVPEQSGLLSTHETEITNTEVELLLHNLASGTWSSVEVTTAFYKRAIIAHQLVSWDRLPLLKQQRMGTDRHIQVNCLTEIFVERALQRARELDEHLKKTGEVVGPLHGLPISLKDQICIKGLEATMGKLNSTRLYGIEA